MVWKQPKISEIKASKEIKDLIGKSIYFNREGNLQDSSLQTRIEYGTLFLVIILGMTAILRLLFGIN